MIVFVVLLVVGFAIVGAFLHPVLLLLRILHVDHVGAVAFLDRAKSFIADLSFWGLLGLLTTSALILVRSRLTKKGLGQTAEDPQDKSSRNEEDLGPVKIVVAVTAYDEADVIAQAVRDFKAQEDVITVIVVDNNSRDGTAARAMAAGAHVVREAQQGYGHACIRGLRESVKIPEATVVVLTEGDGTFSASDLKKFLNYIHQADMVIGTRVVPGLVEQGSQMDHFFIWGNVVISTLLRLRFWNSQFLGAARLSDVGCTYRAIRREALERILPDLAVGGNHFSLHMMLVALARGLSIIEIPITFGRRVGTSKGASRSVWQGLKVGMAMTWHVMTYVPMKHSSFKELGRSVIPGGGPETIT